LLSRDPPWEIIYFIGPKADYILKPENSPFFIEDVLFCPIPAALL